MSQNNILDRLIKDRELPLVGSLLFVYIAVLFFQTDQHMTPIHILGFLILAGCHGINYVFRERIYGKRLILYFISQGICIFLLAYSLGTNYKSVYLGLIPLILCQAISLLTSMITASYVIFFFYVEYIGTVLYVDGVAALFKDLSLLLLISASLFTYYYFYNRQLDTNKIQQVLQLQLEEAYQSLETAVKERERQRLARELHDTLAQSVAGMVMKLDAMDAFVRQGQIEKGLTISAELVKQGKNSLIETRNMIADLRANEDLLLTLSELLNEEILNVFEQQEKIKIKIDIEHQPVIEQSVLHQVRFIIRELLQNVKKHAKATEIEIEITQDKEHCNIRIRDNGIGFDERDYLYHKGHYGIKGITERCSLIKGYIFIDSRHLEGTTVSVIIPKEVCVYE